MAKRTRWVEFTMPVLVRVEIDDEFEDERVTQVVLALGDADPMSTMGGDRRYHGITLAENENSRPTVYDGAPDADMAVIDDQWAREAVRVAEYRHWPPRRAWEEGDHPVDDPDYYDLDLAEEDEEDLDEPAMTQGRMTSWNGQRCTESGLARAAGVTSRDSSLCVLRCRAGRLSGW